MFLKLAGFVGKYRLVITIFWLALAVVLFLVSPRLSEVGVTDESQFLPQGTESASARALLKEKFVTEAEVPASSGLIVLYQAQGFTEQDMQEARAIRDWLLSDSAPEPIDRVVSVLDGGASGSTLLSADRTIMLMLVDFSVPPLDEAAKQAVEQIREYLHGRHSGFGIYLSGEVGFFNDLFESMLQTIDRATLVTVILVAVLLLIVYRSPIAALLPLITIGCSFVVARGILGYLAASGLQISTLADAYLVVTIFGIGTDYCLFIVSRFREELFDRKRDEAQSHALSRIGPVITASAATVIVAFLSLAVSRFGMTRTTGYALAIGVAVTLIAGLTLVPALMSLFGRHIFWPVKTSGKRRNGGFGWSSIGGWISKRPVTVALPIIVVLLLPYTALFHLTRSADVVSQMPQSAESVKGYKVLKDHFPVGEFSPLYLLVQSPNGSIVSQISLQAIDQIAGSLKGISGVSRIDYYSAPSNNLAALAMQVRSIGDGLGKGSPDMGAIVSLQTSSQFLQKLAVQYPGIVQSQNFRQSAACLTEISGIAGQVQSVRPEDLPALLAQLQKAIYRLADSLEGLLTEFRLVGNSPFTASLLATYFSKDETTARINIVLSSDPRSAETLKTVDRLREAVAKNVSASALKGSYHYIGGESATRADIMHTTDADFGRVTGLATAGILLVIIILLRSLLAPLYMVGTVLLNYGATLGISTWLFLDLLKQGSMIYMIPIFIFVILVALGADYNIFLVSRIREEAQHRPIREAVHHAVANTGGVITACGIILASTYATLMTAPLHVVFQVGSAIAIGVIVDTFIVRALLVPSIVAIAGRWSWWPSRLFKRIK